MPIYSYKVKIKPDEFLESQMEAQSQQEVVERLAQKGYFPISIRLKNPLPKKIDGFILRKIPSKDVVLFTQQLANLINSNVEILSALHLAAGQVPNKYLRAILNEVIAKVKDGKPLSESLAAFPKVFSSLYTSLLRAAEVSGTMKQILGRLSDFLEKDEEFKNSLRAALVYPIFVCLIGALTIIILLIFVVPRIAQMFEDMGQVLPLATRMLIYLSVFLQRNGKVILLLAALVLFLLRRFHRSPAGRMTVDKLKLKPIIPGQIILKTEISRLARILSLLLSSGISVVPALEVCISVIDNRALRAEVARFREEIIKGNRLSWCLKNSKFFPEFVTNIISIGEEAGALEDSLEHLADDYERVVDRSLKTLLQMVEPVIILAVGITVGFIVLAMLLPIFQINIMMR